MYAVCEMESAALGFVFPPLLSFATTTALPLSLLLSHSQYMDDFHVFLDSLMFRLLPKTIGRPFLSITISGLFWSIYVTFSYIEQT